MNPFRVIFLGGTVALSSLVVCLVCADRLAHQAASPPRTARVATAEPVPAAPGTVTQGPEEAVAAPPRMADGFDTERLNALMRGETLPAPAPKR